MLQTRPTTTAMSIYPPEVVMTGVYALKYEDVEIGRMMLKCDRVSGAAMDSRSAELSDAES